ncbi:hypothetical protein [Nostoc sphaeroides]|uniref:hypothetical protein n=1 Tax=Nostoc sphaeroides TaxID=446679 RepID=UPI001883B862|nr:hypothetical protein [Nostoc sphaeroides]
MMNYLDYHTPYVSAHSSSDGVLALFGGDRFCKEMLLPTASKAIANKYRHYPVAIPASTI